MSNGPPLVIAHESKCPRFSGSSLRYGQIDVGCQVGVDLRDRLAIQFARLSRCHHQSRPSRRAPPPHPEPSLGPTRAQKMSPVSLIRSSTLRLAPPRIALRRQQPGPLRLPRRDLRPRLLEPVAHQVGLRRARGRRTARTGRPRTASPSSARILLAAQERRVADDHIRLRPLRLRPACPCRRRTGQDRVHLPDRCPAASGSARPATPKPFSRSHWM